MESRPWEQGGRNLGIRLRGKSGLRGWKTTESKSQTAQTRCAQTAVRSDSQRLFPPPKTD
ncbi:hypothetical protein K360107B91_33240 [Enterocloster bolteae]